MNTKQAAEVATNAARKMSEYLTTSDLHKDLERARTLAHWLDSKFEVGGFRFGLQGLVGLLPVGGDTVATLVGFYPFLVAYRHQLGNDVLAKLAANLGLQWSVGLLPWIGDYADVWFKANLRNLAVLEKAVTARESVKM